VVLIFLYFFLLFIGKKGCEIFPGSTIKLGSILIKIIKISLSDPIKPIKQEKLNETPRFETERILVSPKSPSPFVPISKICRFCLEDTESIENPMVSPCNCTGTVKFVHLKCLRHYYENKGVIAKVNSEIVIFLIKSLYCELCRSQIKGIFLIIP